MWSERLLAYSPEFLDLIAHAVEEAGVTLEEVSLAAAVDAAPLKEEELEPLVAP